MEGRRPGPEEAARSWSGSASAIGSARGCTASAHRQGCSGSKQKCFIMELWWPRTLRGSIRSQGSATPRGTPHSLGHSQEDVGVVLTLLQGIDALGLPLGPCLKKDGFRPQDTCNSDTRTPPLGPRLCCQKRPVHEQATPRGAG